jgi:flagellar FliL protein
MATQAIEQAPETAADAASAPAKGRGVMMLAVAGLVAGAAAGLFGLGPVLAKKRAMTPPPPPKVEAEAKAAVTHEIANLVLNPANSNGQRFLMVTATFELKDGGAEEMMKEREAEVRDHILSLLGKKTVEELTDIARRDEVKQEVLEAIAPMFPKGAVVKVFFPQFVVQ